MNNFPIHKCHFSTIYINKKLFILFFLYEKWLVMVLLAGHMIFLQRLLFYILNHNMIKVTETIPKSFKEKKQHLEILLFTIVSSWQRLIKDTRQLIQTTIWKNSSFRIMKILILLILFIYTINNVVIAQIQGKLIRIIHL